MARLRYLTYSIFSRAVNAYKRLVKRPITKGGCDVWIEADPLWNHVFKNDKPLVKLIREECNGGELLMSFHEAANLIWATRETKLIFGEVAEVGSYSGASANLILNCVTDDIRMVNLFDTFDGIPEVTQGIDNLDVGDIRGLQLSAVKSKLSKHASRLKFHVGIFPDTTLSIHPETKFSLVNLDADTYQTTLAALKYFYPRMSRGGFILCHDYSSISCPGVRKAIDEFFTDRDESIIPLWHTQALMIIS